MRKKLETKLIAFPLLSKEDFETLQEIAVDKRAGVITKMNAKISMIMHNQAVLSCKLDEIINKLSKMGK